MKRYITDAHGALWPVTGHWCAGCGFPLHVAVVAEGFTTHPGCDEEANA